MAVDLDGLIKKYIVDVLHCFLNFKNNLNSQTHLEFGACICVFIHEKILIRSEKITALIFWLIFAGNSSSYCCLIVYLFALTPLVVHLMVHSAFTIILYSVLLCVPWTKRHSCHVSPPSLATLLACLWGKSFYKSLKEPLDLFQLSFLQTPNFCPYLPFSIINCKQSTLVIFETFLFFIKWGKKPV